MAAGNARGRFGSARRLAGRHYGLAALAGDRAGDVVLVAAKEHGSCARAYCPLPLYAAFGHTTGRLSSLSRFAFEDPDGVVAVAGRGRAIAVFVAPSGPGRLDDLHLYRRSPGGGFHRGPPRRLPGMLASSLRAALDARGRSLILWEAQTGEGWVLDAMYVSASGHIGRVQTLMRHTPSEGGFNNPLLAVDGRGDALVTVATGGFGPGETLAMFASPRGRFHGPVHVAVDLTRTLAGNPAGGFAVAGVGAPSFTPSPNPGPFALPDRHNSVLLARVDSSGHAAPAERLSPDGDAPEVSFDARGGLFVGWHDRAGPTFTRYAPPGRALGPRATVPAGNSAVQMVAASLGMALATWLGGDSGTRPVQAAVAR